jgi:hypothetical protein
MEAIVLTALVGIGFLTMKSPDAAMAPAAIAGTGGRPPPLAQGAPGRRQVTHTEARNMELARAQALERAAAYPSATGVVDHRARLTRTERGTAGEGAVRSLLTGTDMDEADFRHGNMVPFFGSHLPGPDIERDRGRFVETMSGAPGLGNMRDRMERAPLFTPEERGRENIYGAAAVTDALQARTPVPNSRNNDLPFEQVRVGPGIGSGYGSEGTGGFQQAGARQYVMPKGVDELRPGNSPKAVFDTSAHVLPGYDSTGGARPWQGLVQKHRPDTAFDNSRGSVPNGAPVAAQTVRASYEPRGDVLYHDSAARGFAGGSSRVSALAPAGDASPFDRKLSGAAPPLLNPVMTAAPGCLDGALGREGFFPGGTDSADGGLRHTGRSLAAGAGDRGTGPGAGNAGVGVPRGVIPFLDEARTTQRQFTELSGRTGPSAPVAPSRHPLAPPEHAARTTVRETTGCAPGFARGSVSPAAGGVGPPCADGADPGGDATRRTLREGAPCGYANTVRNVRNPVYGGDTSGGVMGAEPYTPEPTVRELTAHNEREVYPTGGNVVSGAGGGGGYASLVDGCGADRGAGPSPLAGEAQGDGRLSAASTHRQFTGQVVGAEGLSLRPARPEPTGYAVAHAAASETSTSSGARGAAATGYFAAPADPHTKPVDYASIYQATVNTAKAALTESRPRAGHAGAPRGPEAATSGAVQARDGLPDHGRATPGYAASHGAPRSRPSTALREQTASADRLADADALLSWVSTNPLVPR